MKRKKKHEEHHDEAWLLPYSDMMTLLLALFIVMFAMARVDEEKFEEFRSEFGTIFSSRSGSNSIIGNVVDLGTSRVVPAEQAGDGGGEKTGTGDEVRSISGEEAKEAVLAQKLEDQKMAAAREDIKQALTDANLDGDVEVSLRSDGIHISLEDSILFQSGSTNLSNEVRQYLDLISGHIKELNKEVVIAGHTDNVPDPNSTNWELSAKRAIAVMDYLVGKTGVKQEKVSIQAFADTQPMATNQTTEGRTKNRRVEIIVYKDYE